MALLRTRKSAPRSSAAVQRGRLMGAARLLLRTHRLTALTLSDVAAEARVPKSSAYHYFNDIEDLYLHLGMTLHEEMQATFDAPLAGPFASWAEVVGRLIERGGQRFATDLAAQKLLVAPEASFELRLQIIKSDVNLGAIVERHVDRHFKLPDVAERSVIFFRAIEIAALMCSLSFIDHGRITKEMTAEGARAAVAYLGLYIPAKLPRRRTTAARLSDARSARLARP
jgi:AcrR family transcriptional regulator